MHKHRKSESQDSNACGQKGVEKTLDTLCISRRFQIKKQSHYKKKRTAIDRSIDFRLWCEDIKSKPKKQNLFFLHCLFCTSLSSAVRKVLLFEINADHIRSECNSALHCSSLSTVHCSHPTSKCNQCPIRAMGYRCGLIFLMTHYCLDCSFNLTTLISNFFHKYYYNILSVNVTIKQRSKQVTGGILPNVMLDLLKVRNSYSSSTISFNHSIDYSSMSYMLETTVRNLLDCKDANFKHQHIFLLICCIRIIMSLFAHTLALVVKVM